MTVGSVFSAIFIAVFFYFAVLIFAGPRLFCVSARVLAFLLPAGLRLEIAPSLRSGPARSLSCSPLLA